MSALQAIVIFLLGFSPFLSKVQAQNSGDDSNFIRIARQNTIDHYHKQTGINSNLYLGKEYIRYAHSFLKEDQYFLSNSLHPETVYYGGVVYRDVPVLYDIARDEPVILHHDNTRFVTLIPEHLDSFTLHQRLFVRMTQDSTKAIATGFYEQLYKGKLALYARHKKELSEIIDQRSVYYSVSEKTSYYVFKDNAYHLVKKKKAVFDLLKDRRSQLQLSLKQSHINYRKAEELALVQLITLYDQLTN